VAWCGCRQSEVGQRISRQTSNSIQMKRFRTPTVARPQCNRHIPTSAPSAESGIGCPN
jgi:hypothetical protein